MSRFLITTLIVLISGYLFPAHTIAVEKTKVNTHHAMILDISERNKTGNTELIALKHCFDIFAIQYTITDDITKASGAPVIFTAGDLRNTTFSPAELNQLYSYVENGGVLVSQVVIGNKLFPLFGINNVSDSRKRFKIKFSGTGADKSLIYLNRPEELTVSIGNKKIYKEVIWTHAYNVTDAKPLASTEDKKIIFSVNQYGSGSAYALGVSLSDTVLLPHVGNDFEAQRNWINSFEPGADVFLLIMKAIYEEYTTPFIYLSAIPSGREKVLILTHDVDAQLSFVNMIKFAELERDFNVSATYFITTKYFKDAMDIGYYDPGRIEYIRQVKKLGGDIGSHSVSHSVIFEKFPVGTINTTRKNYLNSIKPSVFGEVKVSKELLDKDIPSQNTIAWRSGNLRFPYALIDTLEKCGYKYDSSFSANDIMTNYAYKAFKQRKVGAEESSIIEIPVIFDDSQGLLTPKNMNELVAKWIDIINANGENEAISVLLIHSSETGYKLKAEENLLNKISEDKIWIGNLTEYGEFWEARNQLRYESSWDGSTLLIKILNPVIDKRISLCIKNAPAINIIRIFDKNNKELKFRSFKNKSKILINF